MKKVIRSYATTCSRKCLRSRWARC